MNGATAETRRAFEKELVFVVDDEAVNRTILCGLLSRLGFRCKEYRSGREVLSAFEEAFPNGQHIAAILMDINMPDMDGLEAVWRIRNIEEYQKQLCSCRDHVVPPSVHLSHSEKEFLHNLQLSRKSHEGKKAKLSEPEDSCRLCRVERTPIWAVSGCSIQEQALSPSMKLIQKENEGPPWKVAGFDAFVPKPIQPHQLSTMLKSNMSEGTEGTEMSLNSSCQNRKLSLQRSVSGTSHIKFANCALDRQSECGEDVSQLHSDSTAISELCTEAS